MATEPLLIWLGSGELVFFQATSRCFMKPWLVTCGMVVELEIDNSIQSSEGSLSLYKLPQNISVGMFLSA